MKKGYIYLRHQPGNAYCFGKTIDRGRRDKEYRKENPFLVNVVHFETHDIDAAEKCIIRATQKFRIFANSSEWLAECPEVIAIFNKAREIWEHRPEPKPKRAAPKYLSDAERNFKRNSARIPQIESQIRMLRAMIEKETSTISRYEESFRKSGSSFSSYMKDLPALVGGAIFFGGVAAFLFPVAAPFVFIGAFFFEGEHRSFHYHSKKNHEKIPAMLAGISSAENEIKRLESELSEVRAKILAVSA